MSIIHPPIVLPSFLPFDLLSALQSTHPEYQLGWKSHSENDQHGHAVKDYTETGKHNLADVADRLPPVLKSAWEACQDHPPITKAHKLIRAYEAVHAFASDGHFHRDSDSDDQMTVVIFLNPEWQLDWAGELVFAQDGEITGSVMPCANRAVLFPSDVLHCARGISRSCPVIRRTLILKTRPARSATFERLSGFLYAQGAVDLPHAKGSLHDHLLRVYQLLEDKGLPEDVCLAGGLHSVFGTQSYHHVLITDPAIIVEAWGQPVFDLIREFVSSDPNPSDQVRMIQAANLLDQSLLNRSHDLQEAWYSYAA